MIRNNTKVLLALAASATTIGAVPAAAYPIDCAILLCLAGGWPASAECFAAKAEFIRRITPFPIEPPLQLWRCPIVASKTSDQSMMQWLAKGTALGATTQARSEIANPGFDFAQSIRVWHVRSYRHIVHGAEGVCQETHNISVGTYDTQGSFSWATTSPASMPLWMGLSRECSRTSSFRGVGVEWSDYIGNHDFEVVMY